MPPIWSKSRSIQEGRGGSAARPMDVAFSRPLLRDHWHARDVDVFPVRRVVDSSKRCLIRTGLHRYERRPSVDV